MQHLGDIRFINGADVPPVDVIIGGSPCQDLSIAGLRNGLKGSRSNLFFEQLRIIMEMRVATNNEYPKFMLWENVPGAFSSNNGEDFRHVLEKIVSIAEPGVSVPQPPTGGKWSCAGTIMGDGYSIAWRVLDAQYWGVPQRRRRIALVADFRANSAPEILFESESVSRNTQSRTAQRQNSACQTKSSSRAAAWVILDNHPQDSRIKPVKNTIVPTLSARMGTGGNNIPLLFNQSQYDKYVQSNIASTLRAAGNPAGGNLLLDNNYIRRLTPLECERLQGFPDGWTDIGSWTDSGGKIHKTTDSARYKALGNSIALPPWYFVLSQISAHCETTCATMASLFDGIGGFPLIWESINGVGTCLWASEIEEFPMAVTKLRFAH